MNIYQKILSSWKVPEGKSTDQAWNELELKLAGVTAQKGRVVQFNWKPLVASVAAAAVLIMAVVMIWPKSRLIRMETGFASQKTVVLPDNSIVLLNSSSSIEYNPDWSGERTVTLDGQAFFEVEKGSKFSVATRQGKVEVLGTSFDVFARPEKFRVECHTGRVSVSSGKNNIQISPGNAVQLTNGLLEVSTIDLDQSGWTTGTFYYVDEPIENVFREMERQFGITIEMPESSNRPLLYTGKFTTNDLKVALDIVCVPMQLKFEITDNKVIISESAR